MCRVTRWTRAAIPWSVATTGLLRTLSLDTRGGSVPSSGDSHMTRLWTAVTGMDSTAATCRRGTVDNPKPSETELNILNSNILNRPFCLILLLSGFRTALVSPPATPITEWAGARATSTASQPTQDTTVTIHIHKYSILCSCHIYYLQHNRSATPYFQRESSRHPSQCCGGAALPARVAAGALGRAWPGTWPTPGTGCGPRRHSSPWTTRGTSRTSRSVSGRPPEGRRTHSLKDSTRASIKISSKKNVIAERSYGARWNIPHRQKMHSGKLASFMEIQFSVNREKIPDMK